MSRYMQRGYMARNAKVDANQPEIVAALEAVGATVAEIGKPLDLLVGFSGVNFIIEVKNPNGKNIVEADQETFIDEWKGRRPTVVRNAREALDVIARGVTFLPNPPERDG